MTAVRGEERSGDCLKKVKGLKNSVRDPWRWTTVWASSVETGGLAGWRGTKRENWDNCNSIDNKNKNKTFIKNRLINKRI